MIVLLLSLGNKCNEILYCCKEKKHWGVTPRTGYAETDLKKIYGLRDKEALRRIIHETEKVIEKSPSDKEGLNILGIAYHNLGILKVSGAPDKAVEYLVKAKEALGFFLKV